MQYLSTTISRVKSQLAILGCGIFCGMDPSYRRRERSIPFHGSLSNYLSQPSGAWVPGCLAAWLPGSSVIHHPIPHLEMAHSPYYTYCTLLYCTVLYCTGLDCGKVVRLSVVSRHFTALVGQDSPETRACETTDETSNSLSSMPDHVPYHTVLSCPVLYVHTLLCTKLETCFPSSLSSLDRGSWIVDRGYA
jgi:hypothetical protein